MDRYKHKLAHPTKIRNQEYTELTVRRPLVRDLIAAERQPGDVASGAALVALCADVPFADFGYFDAEDFRAILAKGELHGFFPSADGGAGSGETSSSELLHPLGARQPPRPHPARARRLARGRG